MCKMCVSSIDIFRRSWHVREKRERHRNFERKLLNQFCEENLAESVEISAPIKANCAKFIGKNELLFGKNYIQEYRKTSQVSIVVEQLAEWTRQMNSRTKSHDVLNKWGSQKARCHECFIFAVNIVAARGWSLVSLNKITNKLASSNIGKMELRIIDGQQSSLIHN